jgi:hypothetical protein
LTARAPTPAERVDIQVGMEAARQLARLDIGQTVVVKRKVVVAVEALEGTDATMRRAGELAGGLFRSGGAVGARRERGGEGGGESDRRSGSSHRNLHAARYEDVISSIMSC